MSEKIRYEIDPYNRLVMINDSTSLPKQRRVLDGVFAIGAGNSLSYRVKSPAGYSEDMPYQVKLNGRWSLTKDHNLKFGLDKSCGGFAGDSLEIAGEIIDAKANALLFSVTTKRSNDIRTTYLLEVSGAWQADKNNRLLFKIARGDNRYDTLIFEAGWEVNSNNEIVYRYEKSQLKRRVKIIHSLILRGQWNVSERGVIAYQMEARSNSTFNFKTSLGICGSDYIKYEIGIKLAKHLRPVTRTVTLFGAWRIKKNSALYFDVECANGQIYSISFSAEARLTSRDSISFRIKSDHALKDLGLRFELNHALLDGDGKAFLRVLRSREESHVMVGAGLNW